MSEQNEFSETPGTPRWVGLLLVALAVVSLVALGEGLVASNRAKTLQATLTSQRQVTSQSQDALNQELAQQEETSAQVRSELDLVTSRLQLTQSELNTARKQAQVIKAEDARKLDSVQTQLAEKANADDVNKIGTDVNGVKSDLANTQQTLASARGELGMGIAHNHAELEQLRALGERNYYEFKISGKGSRQKVGDMLVELRGTNVKRSQFTVWLFADDLHFEKKNRSLDEPIFFYTSEYKAPLEFVVNQIGKNEVGGYLSVPKAGVTSPGPAVSALSPASLTVSAQATPR